MVCDYLTLVTLPNGRNSIGPCGQPAGRKFRVTPETPGRGGAGAVRVVDRSLRTISWRCAKHSPLSRRTRSPFRVTFDADTGDVVSVESIGRGVMKLDRPDEELV